MPWSRPGLRFPDQSLDLQDIGRIGLTGFFQSHELLNSFFDCFRLYGVYLKISVKRIHKIGESPGIVVENRDFPLVM